MFSPPQSLHTWDGHPNSSIESLNNSWTINAQLSVLARSPVTLGDVRKISKQLDQEKRKKTLQYGHDHQLIHVD